MAMNYQKLIESVKTHHVSTDSIGVSQRRKPRNPALHGLHEALVARQIDPYRDLDLGRLFAECFGYARFMECRNDAGMPAARVMEDAGAVTSSAFLNITQQFAYSAILQAYDIPERPFSKIIPSRPSKFRWERVPGVAHVGDEADEVKEAEEFPLAGTTEDYIDTPETRKRGMRIPITKEAVFFDQTGLVLERCRQVGDWLGVNKEKRAITCVVDGGETSTQQYRYNWKGTKYATYSNGSDVAGTTWSNQVANNALSDYTTIQTAWNQLVKIVDPYTGEPQNVTIRHIVVPPLLIATVPFALKGMVKRVAPGYATSGDPTNTEVPNPMGDIVGNIQTVSSQLFRSISGSDSMWFLGDLTAAFEYIENWPIQVLSLGAGSHDEFHRDIVAQFRADERGTFNTKQPRKMVVSFSGSIPGSGAGV